MAGGRFNLSTLQELSNAGLLQSGSRLRFCVAGDTNTLQDTYTAPGLVTPNANPMVADSYGRFDDIWMSDLAYRVEVLPPAGDDTPVFVFDPVYKDRVIVQATAAPANPWPDMEYVNTTDGRRYRRNRANNAWVDLGPYDGVGNTAAISDIITGTSDTLFVTPDALYGLWGKGTDIASATTLTIPASEGGFFVVTGSVQIDGIAATTEGRRILLYFTGEPLLNDGASFDLGGQDIQAVANMACEFLYYNSIWHLVNVMVATSPTRATKTADYTVTDADRDGIIVYSGMSADRTLTLPAAAGRAGFRFTLVLRDTTYGVTVDGNAAELVDGQATRKTFGPTTIEFFCDGTGWYSVGTWLFVTTATWAATGSIDTAHGQPHLPKRVGIAFKCLTTDGGYAVGDILDFKQGGTSSAVVNGTIWGGNATNLFYKQGTGVAPGWTRKDTNANFTPTFANWQVNLVGEF